MEKHIKTGLIVGKFFPPTLGHLFLIEFADKRVDELIVIVGSLPTEAIDGNVRSYWLQKMVSEKTIILHVPDDNPDGLTSDKKEYWEIWKQNLTKHLPYVPEYLFASENYGIKLAEVMGMKYVAVDPKRKHVPISATQIREHPQKYWKFIPDVVKPYYEKIIAEQKAS